MDPRDHSDSEMKKAARRVKQLEARLQEAQDRYDASDAGLVALETAINDGSLDETERNDLKVRLAEARERRDAQDKVLTDAENRRDNVMRFLEEAGVPADERAEFSDVNIYQPAGGSSAHYEKIKNRRREVHGDVLSAYHHATTYAKSPEEQAAVEANEGVAVAKAAKDYYRALYVYDSTPAGIASLKKAVEAHRALRYGSRDYYIKGARLDNRLANALHTHELNKDARNLRDAKLAQLRAVCAAHNADVSAAVQAFKNKMPQPKTGRIKTPANLLRTSHVFANLTEQDVAIVGTEFRNSEEFKTYGETGMSRFLERKIMVAPHEIYLKESVAEADARVRIGSTGKVGRNNTVITDGGALARDNVVGVSISARNRAIIDSRAKFLEMTTSSYIRALVLGQNPVAQANDRSKQNRRRKRAKMTRIVREGIVAA